MNICFEQKELSLRKITDIMREENITIDQIAKFFKERLETRFEQYYDQSLSHLDMNSVMKMSKQMIKDSKNCVKKFPSLRTHVNACEVGIKPTHAQNFSLHSHTIKEEEGGLLPSERDKETTRGWNKDFLCIANSAEKKLVVFHKEDNFEKAIVNRRI